MALVRRLAVFLSVALNLLLVTAFLSSQANAIGFQPPTPDELKMTSEPQAPGAPAIILFREVDRDDNTNTGHEDDYFRIKILTEEGRKYADVEIPYFQGQGSLVNVHGRTIHADGSIINFDGKVFEKTIIKSRSLKYLAKTFSLPSVEVGSIIEYSYTLDLREHYIFDSHWVLSDELFTRDAKFTMKPFHSDYGEYYVRWDWNYLPAGSTPPAEGPDHIVRLEAHNIPAFQSEDFMPPEDELKSRVDFIYSRDPFDPNIERFWKNSAKRLHGQMEGFVGKHKAMEEAVAQIVSPSDSPETKLRKIYARVQQLRNTSYEVQKTEQEQKRAKEKEAANVEDVWKRGYGNGVQLTWLFLALARAAGIEADGVWVSDRRNYFFNPRMMDSSKLDENVVRVKLDGKDLYCDPGAAFVPFGYLPWSETAVPGLILDKDGGWVTTSMPDSSASRIERKADLKLSADTGGLEGKLMVTYTGMEAARRRLEERNEDETARKTFLEEEVKEFIPAAAEVDLANKPDWSSSDPTLVAQFDIKVPGWAAGAGRRALLPVGLFSASEKHVFEHANRVHPIYFEFPSQRIDDLTINLPLGWQVSSLPPAKNDDRKGAVYTLKVANDKGTLHVQRTLNMDLLLLETKFYPTLRAFFQGVRTGDEEQIVLQPMAATAAN